MTTLCAHSLPGLPEIATGADLAALVVEAAARARQTLTAETIVAVAHKAVSKAEGAIVALADVRPSPRARQVAVALGKEDPRAVQVVLDESQEIVRAERGVLISRTRHGFVCANAGVDASNAPGQEILVLLPRDPDASARRLRAGLSDLVGVAPAVLITDSFGRAWRHGQSDVAIGCAGLAPLEDWRGRPDSVGRGMSATWLAVADNLAALSDLARSKDSREPVVLIHGLGRFVTDHDGAGAGALVRAQAEDLFP